MQFYSVDFESSKSLYMQISDMIEDGIIKKEISVGQRIPSERELCKVFGVSLITVKEAMAKLEREGYISRRPKYGTFIINSKPQKGIDLKRKNELCLVICPSGTKSHGYASYFEHPGYQRLIDGIEKKAKEKDMFLVYSIMDNAQLSLEKKKKDIAGLIVSGFITRKFFNVVKKSKIPFLLIGDIYQKTITSEDVDVIAFDAYMGGYLGAKHLIDLGHRRIVYLAHSLGRYYWEAERFRGYIEAHREAGITCDRSLQLEVGEFGAEYAYKVMKEFLEKSIPFTGIVCMEDLLWIGMMKALREKGMRIPEDVSAVKYGITAEMAAGYTMVTWNNEESGKVAVERLLYKLTGSEWKPQRIVLKHRLVAGNSTMRIENYRK